MQKRMAGDVTTYISIAGKTGPEIEMRLGYKPGRLSAGFDVYELKQEVSVGDFEWTDRTRYSGGWQLQRGIGEFARRFDVLRAEYGKKFGYDEARVDQELDKLLRREAAKLNIRIGPNRIVKVFPVTLHDPRMFWLEQYPNAQFRDIPQWTILKTHPKEFALLASVSGRSTFR